jgi:hypothetical protein
MTENYRELLVRLKEFGVTLPKTLASLKTPNVSDDIYSDEILPFELYRGKRDNITRIGDQINKAYHYKIYDGCAVLMRRLLEMLLIQAFIENGIESEILDSDGNYFQLSDIIKVAIQSRKLGLSRNAKGYLDPFREKGNLSAHNPFHNARRKDLEILQPKFRHLAEELFYKAGIIK